MWGTTTPSPNLPPTGGASHSAGGGNRLPALHYLLQKLLYAKLIYYLLSSLYITTLCIDIYIPLNIYFSITAY